MSLVKDIIKKETKKKGSQGESNNIIIIAPRGALEPSMGEIL